MRDILLLTYDKNTCKPNELNDIINNIKVTTNKKVLAIPHTCYLSECTQDELKQLSNMINNIIQNGG